MGKDTAGVAATDCPSGCFAPKSAEYMCGDGYEYTEGSVDDGGDKCFHPTEVWQCPEGCEEKEDKSDCKPPLPRAHCNQPPPHHHHPHTLAAPLQLCSKRA